MRHAPFAIGFLHRIAGDGFVVETIPVNHFQVRQVIGQHPRQLLNRHGIIGNQPPFHNRISLPDIYIVIGMPPKKGMTGQDISIQITVQFPGNGVQRRHTRRRQQPPGVFRCKRGAIFVLPVPKQCPLHRIGVKNYRNEQDNRKASYLAPGESLYGNNKANPGRMAKRTQPAGQPGSQINNPLPRRQGQQRPVEIQRPVLKIIAANPHHINRMRPNQQQYQRISPIPPFPPLPA